MKTLSTLVMVFAFSLSAHAANKRCGFGSKLFGGNKGVISQTFENATNNSCSGQQSIMMGTSGCKHNGYYLFPGFGALTPEQIMYVEANFEELQVEMAHGQGETLNGLAAVLGCGPSVVPVFNQMTQEHYGDLIPSGEVAPVDVLVNIRRTMEENTTVSQGCVISG